MIFKKIAARSKKTSETNRISRLIRYVTNPEKSINPDFDESQTKTEKCTYFRAVNYFSIGLDIEQICIETIELAEQKHANASHVFCHYLLSFDSYYKPSNSDIDFSVNILIERFGMKDCQYIYGRHDDTNNTHVHILINRVNPVTYQAHRINSGFDIKAGQEALQIIVKALKLTRPVKSANASYLPIEIATGFESKDRTIHKIIMPVLATSRSWSYFHLQLHEKNVAIMPSKDGLAIAYGSYYVQASKIDGQLSRKNLEKKFGSYQHPENKFVSDTCVDEQYIPLKLICDDILKSKIFAMYLIKHQKSLELHKNYLQIIAESRQKELEIEKNRIEAKLKKFALNASQESVIEAVQALQKHFENFKAQREKYWIEEMKKAPPPKDHYFERWCKSKNINIKKFYDLNNNLDFEKQRIEIRIKPENETPLDDPNFNTSEIPMFVNK